MRVYLQFSDMYVARKIIQSRSYAFCIASETFGFSVLYFLGFDS